MTSQPSGGSICHNLFAKATVKFHLESLELSVCLWMLLARFPSLINIIKRELGTVECRSQLPAVMTWTYIFLFQYIQIGDILYFLAHWNMSNWFGLGTQKIKPAYLKIKV